MQNRPIPPLIPGSFNNSSLYSEITKMSTLEVQNSVSFFGADPTNQLIPNNQSMNSIIPLLQSYGLVGTGFCMQDGGKLVGLGGVGTQNQGISVALSFDGTTLAVGALADNTRIGAVWVFTKTNGFWSQQTPSKLTGSSQIGEAYFGASVSLSSDGNTLAVGGYRDNSDIGATWIFIRNDNIWTQQAKLVGTGNINSSYQGCSIALSSDGNTLVVGGQANNDSEGAIWIFTRTGTNWIQEAGPLVGSGAIGNANQGCSVDISQDGNTVAVGGFADDSNIGATWVYVKSGGIWSQQGSKLVGSGYIGNSGQGYSVSIRKNTLVSGGIFDNNNIGATWVFKRTGITWSQVGNKIIGTGSIGNAQQGTSVSLSDDENTFITSGGSDNNNIGAVWVFTLENGLWTQIGNKLIGGGYVGNIVGFGFDLDSVFISGDGKTIAVGGPQDLNDGIQVGATWIFLKY